MLVCQDVAIVATRIATVTREHVVAIKNANHVIARIVLATRFANAQKKNAFAKVLANVKSADA